MLESALAGGFTGFCAAVFTAYLSTVLKRLNNDPEVVLRQYDAFAISGSHVAVVCQFAVNIWLRWRSRNTHIPSTGSAGLQSLKVKSSE